MQWFCSICSHPNVIQFCCCGDNFKPKFSFILLIQSCLDHHCSCSTHGGWYFSFCYRVLLRCAMCCKFKNYSQILPVTFLLETTVSSTVVQSDPFYINSIFVVQSFDPNWCYNCLVTICFQEKTVILNRKISMIFPLVSCCSCFNNPSSS